MSGKSDAMKLYDVYHTALDGDKVTDEARTALESALAMGDPEVYYSYSEDLRQIKKNQAEAWKWEIKAADGGCADACLYASIAYRKGIGVSTDYEKAMHYAQKYVELTGRKDERLWLRVEDVCRPRLAKDDDRPPEYDFRNEDVPWWRLVCEKYPESRLASFLDNHSMNSQETQK